MSLSELKKYTFRAKYANYNNKTGKRETWHECVSRSEEMMLEKYQAYKIDDIIKEAYSAVKRKEILGSQRTLQFAGSPILNKNERGYNCLHRDTQFITNKGVKSFNNFKDGDNIVVLSHTGKWQQATVRQYGKQWLNKISINRKQANYTIYATENHRWYLNDETVTESLRQGDKLLRPANIFSNFDYENAEPLEKLYWCYGYVLGDGTLVKKADKYTHSCVRLCDKDRKYKYRFEENGFITSSSASLKGDFIAYTGTYLKTLPDPNLDSPELIRAFVRGFLDADGGKNSNINNNHFITIQQSSKENIEFIRKCFPVAGIYIVSETDLTGQETNFGIRPYTINFRITNCMDGTSTSYFTINNIEEKQIYDTVWCLEVENDQSFVLPNGIVTGNCSASYVDRPRFFQECMFLLLCGCGTGFSVQKHHVNKLPNLNSKLEGTITYTIPDTIEGWADAIGVLVNSYFNGGIYSEYEGKIVHFDYTNIRHAGSSLSYTTGKAPGPEPLKNSIEKIRKLLNNALQNGQKKLKPIQAYDIIMHSSDAVLAGGVRRSASICLFSLDDEEMMKAKIGNWFIDNPQRARSNNSVVLLKNEVSWNQFQEIIKNTKEYGEPGFAWISHPEGLYNPCFEIGFWAYHIENQELFDSWFKNNYNSKIECEPEDIGLKSGWQFCNLSTINGGKCDSKEKFLEACRQAATIGTLQAGFTSFPYLGNTSEEIAKREALIGVSITGVMENPDILLDPQIQRIGADLIVQTNHEIADMIGINWAARTTCLKPEGTSSCVLGTSSGIHPHHAKRYFRRVQATRLEGLYQYFKNINPYACEPSVWSKNETDDVITFCIEVPKGSRTKNQLSAIELLQRIQSTQQNWVKYGKTSLSTQPWLTHNVSNTVTVKPEEWDEVARYIYDNREDFCGISLLPDSGDKDYQQAPFTTVYTPEEMLEYYGDAAFFTSGMIERALELYEDNLWKACDILLGLGEKPKGLAKLEWIESCKKYATKYLSGDIKRLTYLMKDVYNWKLWLDLKRCYKEVDYDNFFEESSQVNINHSADSACAGGSCQLIKT